MVRAVGWGWKWLLRALGQDWTRLRALRRGNVFRPGRGGVTPPRAIYDPIPTTPTPLAKPSTRARYCCGWCGSRRPAAQHSHTALARHGLDEKAVAAVSTWHFQPGTLNGQPVAVEVNVK